MHSLITWEVDGSRMPWTPEAWDSKEISQIYREQISQWSLKMSIWVIFHFIKSLNWLFRCSWYSVLPLFLWWISVKCLSWSCCCLYMQLYVPPKITCVYMLLLLHQFWDLFSLSNWQTTNSEWILLCLWWVELAHCFLSQWFLLLSAN